MPISGISGLRFLSLNYLPDLKIKKKPLKEKTTQVVLFAELSKKCNAIAGLFILLAQQIWIGGGDLVVVKDAQQYDENSEDQKQKK